MNLLVSAGNTQVPIDRVRCLTNIFTGRTGGAIALAAAARGHRVVLLTSHPETVAGADDSPVWKQHGSVVGYRTFADLENAMRSAIESQEFQGVIHAAAINDYHASGIFAPAPGTHFAEADLRWHSAEGPPRLVDRAAGKVKSDEPELWLRLTRAPKLVDRIRGDWGFRGRLVKFKLEVGLSDQQLIEVAERSRRHSQADWMVANTLDGAAEWAFLGPFADGYRKVSRQELPNQLLDVLEQNV